MDSTAGVQRYNVSAHGIILLSIPIRHCHGEPDLMSLEEANGSFCEVVFSI